jgi:hypothetical protein
LIANAHSEESHFDDGEEKVEKYRKTKVRAILM